MKYYRRLALKRIIFCLVYTIFVYLLISYCGDRYSVTTSNITNVKSIETNILKSRIYKNEKNKGQLKYIYKNDSYSINCLDNYIINNNKYYDSTYGELYILKTNPQIACNSILKISTENNIDIYGIVLDIDENQSENIIEIYNNNEKELTENINFYIERTGI